MEPFFQRLLDLIVSTNGFCSLQCLVWWWRLQVSLFFAAFSMHYSSFGGRRIIIWRRWQENSSIYFIMSFLCQFFYFYNTNYFFIWIRYETSFQCLSKKRWTSNNKNRVYRVTERNELYYRGNRNITAVAKLYQNLTNNQRISRVVVGYWNHYFACMTGYLALSCICTHLWYNFFYIVSLTNLVGTKGTFFSFFSFFSSLCTFQALKHPSPNDLTSTDHEGRI